MDEIREQKEEVAGDHAADNLEFESQSAFADKSLDPAHVPSDDLLPPKPDSQAEVLHERVSKQVIKKGRGNKPSQHSTCFLHYRAWAETTMHKFEDTWQEQHPLELVLGREKKTMQGLAIGVAGMKAGERALLHVGWELGYGEEGNFSFPNVPPRANLIYEVELIGFEEAKEGKSRRDMTVEERIEAADRKRQEGNEFYKEEKLEEAMQQYEMALAYLGDDFMFQLFGKYRDMAIAVKNPCHLNLAACLLRLNHYEEAVGHCNMVLTEDEKNIKALFRRGKARACLGQTDDAKEDFQKVQSISPDDKAVRRELKLIAEHEKEIYQKQKEMYKGLFGPKPRPKPNKLHWLVAFWHWILSVLKAIFSFRKSKND
eukprot:TRINITY_DN1140_c0_g1_i1.p1 TRINITY_DN1140_c0_g1~~TRINITY_DN1140_c0_g1_i1.p1  ORF type:complete len:372 (+),score=104.82 TRINITY_DN1140_c0_g1_i1:254-1369(+)